MRRIFASSGALALSVLGFAFAASLAGANSPGSGFVPGSTVGPGDHVPICHALGNGGYVAIAPSAGVVFGHAGLSHQDGADIIPPFSYEPNKGETDSSLAGGQNWASGGPTWSNGCVTPPATTGETTTTTPETTTTTTTTTPTTSTTATTATTPPETTPATSTSVEPTTTATTEAATTSESVTTAESTTTSAAPTAPFEPPSLSATTTTTKTKTKTTAEQAAAAGATVTKTAPFVPPKLPQPGTTAPAGGLAHTP